MAIHKRGPLDYSLCNQTVTVYHKGTESIQRTVYTNAFLDFKKTVNVEKTGSRDASSFLLVIPGGTQAVFSGDKVMLGTGPEVTTETWKTFVPAAVPGLVTVGYVDCKYWNNQMVHTEAGG